VQLQESLRLLAHEGRWVVVYPRGHEGRGIGISDKLRASELQEAGPDTVDANLELGLPVDGRDCGIGAQILGPWVKIRSIGVRRVENLVDGR